MLGTKRIIDRFGDNICRHCINRKYRVHLHRNECKYGHVLQCPCCHESHHIVTGFKFTGQLKMLTKF